MSPRDLIRLTEHDPGWLRDLPTTFGRAAAQAEHAYVVPWQLVSHDVVTVKHHTALAGEATGERCEITIARSADATAKTESP